MGVVNETSYIMQITRSSDGALWPIGSYIYWVESDDDDDYTPGPGWRSTRVPGEARKFSSQSSALSYWKESKSSSLELDVRVRKLEVRTTISNVD